jgi:hypothetical protein
MSGNSGPLPTSGGYVGQEWFQSGGSDFSAVDFCIRQVIAEKAFCGLVKVISVTGGGVGVPSIVSVQPMVNQQDVLANQTPHGIVYNIPCFRLQSGLGAVILDPIVGDIGMAIICDRDISNVKATGAVSPAGSFRQHSWSDGVYFGSVLGGAPTQYVQITQTGVNIVSSDTINLTVGSKGISITSAGTEIDGKMFLPHTHGGVQTGSGSTGDVS